MKFRNFFFLAAISSVLLVSCNDDDGTSAVPLGTYDNGILVLNEGNFTAGSITYIGNDMATVQQDIFGIENPGEGIGGFVQSVFFDGDRAFIISNGSNKITVVNRYTFELIGKIETGFSVPRYGVTVGDKAYVTNLGDFGDPTDDFITVIDLETLAVENPIPVHAIADRILALNGTLYVANGSFGSGSSITVINAAGRTITATIDLGLSPNSMEIKNDKLYVLCSNSTDESRFATIDLPSNNVNSILLPGNLSNAQNLDIDSNNAYFTDGPDVYTMDYLMLTGVSSTTHLITSGATFLYGFAVNNGKIYIADAKTFDVDGEVRVYGTDGSFQKQFAAGLAPNGFYFND